MNRKEEIALDFVNLHKDNDWENWSDVRSLESIYHNLVGGVYGEFEDNNMGDMCVEIDSFDSNSGNRIIFEIEYKDMDL